MPSPQCPNEEYFIICKELIMLHMCEKCTVQFSKVLSDSSFHPFVAVLQGIKGDRCYPHFTNRATKAQRG